MSAFIGTTKQSFKGSKYSISIVDYEHDVHQGWHFHEKKHVLAILKGGNEEYKRNTVYDLKPGDLSAYWDGETHRNRNIIGSSKNIIIEFEEDFFADEIKFNHLHLKPDSFSNFVKIYFECLNPEKDTHETIHQNLYSLFHSDSTITIPNWVQDITELLNDRWNEFIPLNELSKEFRLHPVTISKYFSIHTGYTLAEYMRRIKIYRAVQCLVNSTNNLPSIAHKCGFSDQSHMTRLIKNHLGITPNKIRSI